MVLVDALPCRQAEAVRTELSGRPWRQTGKCPPNTGETLPLARRRPCLEARDPAPLSASTPSAASRARPTAHSSCSCYQQDRVSPTPWLQHSKVQQSGLPSLKYSVRPMAPPGCVNPSLRHRPQIVSLRPNNASSLLQQGDCIDVACPTDRAITRTPATPVWELLHSDGVQSDEDRATMMKTPASPVEHYDRGKPFERPSTTDTCISTAAPESVGFRGGSVTPGTTPVPELLPMAGSSTLQEPTSSARERTVSSHTRGRSSLDKGFGAVTSDVDEGCASDLAGDSIMRSDLAGDSLIRSDLAGDSMAFAGDSLISTWSDVSHSRAEWDARLWCEAREEWSKLGDWRLLHNLWHLTRHTTEQAVRLGHYKVSGCTHRLDSVPSPIWFGESNMKTFSGLLKTDDSVVPPLLVCDADPLEIALQVRRIHGERQQIIVAAELNEFDPVGDLDFKNPACVSPASLPLRTNFQSFVHEAQANLRDGIGNMRAHLSATQDPYVFYCSNVSVFRGSREDGYPFLSQPTHVDVIATAASCMRPELNIRRNLTNNGNMEWFAHEEDHYALLDRLHLLGLVGLSQGQCNFTQACAGVDDERPILILGTLWSGGGRAGRLPRHAYAHALKGWSEVFCRFFRSVFVCCGGKEARGHLKLAQLIDRIANMSTYAAANDWHWYSCHTIPPVIKWHWNAEEIKLAIHPARLEEVFRTCEGHKVKYTELCDRAATIGIEPPGLAADVEDTTDEAGQRLNVPSIEVTEAQPTLSPTKHNTAPLTPTQPKRSPKRAHTEHLVETEKGLREEVDRFNHFEEARVLQPPCGIPHSSNPASTWRHSMVLGDVFEELHHPGETMLSPRESTGLAQKSSNAGGSLPTQVRAPSTPSPQKRRASYFSKAMGSKSLQSAKPKGRRHQSIQSCDAGEIDDLIASANNEFDMTARVSVKKMNEHEDPGSEGVTSYPDAISQPKKQKKKKKQKSRPQEHDKLLFCKPHFYRNNSKERLDAIRRKVCEKVIKAMEPTNMGGAAGQAFSKFDKYACEDESGEELEKTDDDQSRLLDFF